MQHLNTVDDDRLLSWLLRVTNNAYIDLLRQQEELTARLQAVFDL
jgi:DNA-directed RNA polymerase specialized sigma24 family protein